ncbi:hypothetical protein DFH29DRAFT_932484, partial [Suillus ampliporus]
MRFLFLVVIAALTVSISVSATPIVFDKRCGGSGVQCMSNDECCQHCQVSMSGFLCIQDQPLDSPFASVSLGDVLDQMEIRSSGRR